MRRTKGITLIILALLLCGIVVAMLLAQWNSPLARSLTAIQGVLLSFDVNLDVGVLSMCACAALISGLLFLTSDSGKAVIVGWNAVRFLLHLSAIYVIASSCPPRLAVWIRTSFLPLLEVPTSSSSFQFLFSHIFEFSFIPAVIAGLANVKFKHKAAQYVWLVPTIVLAYKFFTFPIAPRSVLDSAPSVFPKLSAAFHQYFAGGFLIGGFTDWRDFWGMVSSNPDMMRGMAQLRVTAPFYAGIGYCLAAWSALRFQVFSELVERAKAWEQSRFDHTET